MKVRRYSASRVAIAIALSVVASVTGCSRGGEAVVDNAIVIVIDTLRTSRLGLYGHDRPTSPFIDSLAREGIVFHRAQATAPWTVPSTATLFTGLYPSEHGAEMPGRIRHLDAGPPQQLAAPVKTLAQILDKRGFATGLFSANPYLYGRFKDGFEVAEVGRTNATELTDRVLDFLRSVDEQRFFVHLQYMDLHQPIEPPEEYVEMFPVPFPGPRGDEHKAWSFPHPQWMVTPEFPEYRAHKLALYDGAMRYVNDEIERLIRGLEELGLSESTLVVITTDHGEEFWDHAEIEAGMGGDPRDVYGVGHGHSMFQEQLWVPLILSGLRASGARDLMVPVSLADLAPTLLDLLAVRGAKRMSGSSLARYLVDSQTPVAANRPLYSESPAYGPESWSLVIWPHKLIVRGDGRMLLFDLDDDPSEIRDLSADRPERLEAMLHALQGFRRDLDSVEPTGEMVMDESTREQLRSLGYLE